MDWQWVNPDTLQMKDPFKSLFPAQPGLKQAVLDDLDRRGYDPAFPIVVWDNVVIDGHTRLIAARERKMVQVAVVRKAFDSVREALEYAVHCQRDRRNLTNEGLEKAIAAIDAEFREEASTHRGRRTDLSTSGPKEPEVQSQRSAEQIGKALGVSGTTVKRVRAILADETPEEIKEKVRSGEVSITKGAEMARAARRPPDKPQRPEQRFIGRLFNMIEMGEEYARSWPLEKHEMESLKNAEDRLAALCEKFREKGVIPDEEG